MTDKILDIMISQKIFVFNVLIKNQIIKLKTNYIQTFHQLCCMKGKSVFFGLYLIDDFVMNTKLSRSYEGPNI